MICLGGDPGTRHADYRNALARQGIGDAEQRNVVLIRTGWDQLWKNNMAKPADQAQRDNMEANSGEPSVEVCDHLAARKVSMLGIDNWGHPDHPARHLPAGEISTSSKSPPIEHTSSCLLGLR